MKHFALAALLLLGLAACSVSTERTVHTAPATAAVVVPAEPPPPTTVYIPE
jgi:hypothetical protein